MAARGKSTGRKGANTPSRPKLPFYSGPRLPAGPHQFPGTLRTGSRPDPKAGSRLSDPGPEIGPRPVFSTGFFGVEPNPLVTVPIAGRNDPPRPSAHNRLASLPQRLAAAWARPAPRAPGHHGRPRCSGKAPGPPSRGARRRQCSGTPHCLPGKRWRSRRPAQHRGFGSSLPVLPAEQAPGLGGRDRAGSPPRTPHCCHSCRRPALPRSHPPGPFRAGTAGLVPARGRSPGRDPDLLWPEVDPLPTHALPGGFPQFVPPSRILYWK